MNAVLVQARAGLRRRWRTWALLVALGALAAGSVLALLAGARRAESAFPRFLRATHAADAYLFAPAAQVDAAKARRLPGVRDVATLTALPQDDPELAAAVLTDPRWGREVNGFKLLEGRRLDPHDPYEVMVGYLLARQLHLHPGSVLTLQVHEPVRFRVVGVEAAAGEFPPRSAFSNLPVYISPAFLDTAAGRAADVRGADAFNELALRLAPGTASDSLFTAVQRAAGAFVSIEAQHDQAADVQRSAHAQAVVVRVVAGITALAALLVLAQLLLRESPDEAEERAALRAIGFTRRQLLRVELLQIGLGAAAVGLGSVVVAVLLSPLFPLGTARTAEPTPGIVADATVLVAGAMAVVVVIAAVGVLASLRVITRVPRRASGRSRLAALLGGAGFPMVMDLGLRQAVDGGRGTRATPVRATLVTATAGVIAIVGLMTVASSIDHLRGTPALYGVTYDLHLEANGNFGDIRPTAVALRRDPAVRDVTVAAAGVPLASQGVQFGGEAVMGSTDPLRPTLLEGRLPSAADEIVLGSRTIDQLHTAIGRTIPVAVVGITSPLPFRVVGRAVIAPLSEDERLGQGAVLPAAAIARLATRAPSDFEVPPPGDAFVRLRGPATPATIEGLQRRLGARLDASIQPRTEPTDVATFGELQQLPWLVTILLAAMALLTMLHLLSSSVRRRRRDLGVLQAIGAVPRQLGSIVAWQAVAVAVLALALGIPLGVAAGRVTWMSLSTWVGVVARPTVPLTLTLGLIPTAIVLALLTALGPARSASRTRPVEVLRTD